MARFFDGAPIVAVSGRNHPIEVRYSQTPGEAEEGDAEEPDLPTAVLQAFHEIAAEPGAIGKGDVLVFLPGEREIRDVGEVLERELQSGVEVLPLYSRLSWEQQSRIFQRTSRRRIVLATNVAETSITVPGIRAVIDAGLARVSRYSPRNRLQRLPIEPVSRASAEQRKGRCGRLGPGLCMRLYSQQDFDARPPFTEPEVLRTNLAALLLRLAADNLGSAEEFPFIDAPDARALNDGYRLLQELQALDDARDITRRGRAMARLPLDPRLARALLESKRFHAESELLAIVAALSVADARIVNPAGPAEESAQAAAFEDPKSEFSALVKLWRAYRKVREGPRRELKRWCKERHLSLLRLSEWEDVYAQVTDRAADIGIIAQRQAASYTAVHRSLLAGFCTMVGTRAEEGAYLGTRGVHFHLFPASPLARRRPQWVMAANIVETSRVFARRVAQIEPMWVESAAQHLVKREYLEPDWDDTREEVVARERLSFLGLVLCANRVVNYGPIAPEEARLIFAREALVYGRLRRRPDWLEANDAAIRAAQQLEERLRTRDLVRNPESFVEFYDKALPRQISSAATLEYFGRRLSAAQKLALLLTPDDIFARLPDPQALAQFPEQVSVDALSLRVDYRFVPGEPLDGASLRVPLLALPGLGRAVVDAAVPGLAKPRIEALLRSLPKDARRSLIPIGETAAAFLASADAVSDMSGLRGWLASKRGISASLLRFDVGALPRHLTPQLTVTDHCETVARGIDLGDLRRRCASRARSALDRRAAGEYPAAWRRFDMEELPAAATLEVEQGTVQVFPTLARRGDSVWVGFEWTEAEAAHRYAQDAVTLARLMLERQARDLAKKIAEDPHLLLAGSAYLQGGDLIDTLLHLVFRRACFKDEAPPRRRDAFESAVDRSRAELYPCLADVSAAALGWFTAAREVRRLLEDARAAKMQESAAESEVHLRRLLGGDALKIMAGAWLRQLPRYLKAEERRWQRLLARGGEAQQIPRDLDHWSQRCRSLEQRVEAELRWIPQLEDLRGWMEEYRVSLYAQELKTLGPISAARLEQRVTEVEAWIER
jgi:ATP-dependent helicase HrpA